MTRTRRWGTSETNPSPCAGSSTRGSALGAPAAVSSIRVFSTRYGHCCGSGMFIPDPDFCPSRIPDSWSIHSNKREGWKRISCPTFFCSQKTSQNKNLFYFWAGEEKTLGRFTNNYRTFYPYNVIKLSIRDSEKTYSGSRTQIRYTGYGHYFFGTVRTYAWLFTGRALVHGWPLPISDILSFIGGVHFGAITLHVLNWYGLAVSLAYPSGEKGSNFPVQMISTCLATRRERGEGVGTLCPSPVARGRVPGGFQARIEPWAFHLLRYPKPHPTRLRHSSIFLFSLEHSFCFLIISIRSFSFGLFVNTGGSFYGRTVVKHVAEITQ